MTPSELNAALAQASKDVQKLNADLARVCPGPGDVQPRPAGKPRIRQDSRPLLNELEKEWLRKMTFEYGTIIAEKIRAQSLRFRLANGLWYKPDFTLIIPQRWKAWEVKGPHAFRGGFENLKMAAASYPDWIWVLVWKEDGLWREQRVLS